MEFVGFDSKLNPNNSGWQMHFSHITMLHGIQRNMSYFRRMPVPDDIIRDDWLILHEIEKVGIESKCGSEKLFLD